MLSESTTSYEPDVIRFQNMSGGFLLLSMQSVDESVIFMSLLVLASNNFRMIHQSFKFNLKFSMLITRATSKCSPVQNRHPGRDRMANL